MTETTSAADSTNATPKGRWSTARFQALRALSHSGSAGRTRSPFRRRRSARMSTLLGGWISKLRADISGLLVGRSFAYPCSTARGDADPFGPQASGGAVSTRVIGIRSARERAGRSSRIGRRVRARRLVLACRGRADRRFHQLRPCRSRGRRNRPDRPAAALSGGVGLARRGRGDLPHDEYTPALVLETAPRVGGARVGSAGGEGGRRGAGRALRGRRRAPGPPGGTVHPGRRYGAAQLPARSG